MYWDPMWVVYMSSSFWLLDHVIYLKLRKKQGHAKQRKIHKIHIGSQLWFVFIHYELFHNLYIFYLFLKVIKVLILGILILADFIHNMHMGYRLSFNGSLWSLGRDFWFKFILGCCDLVQNIIGKWMNSSRVVF